MNLCTKIKRAYRALTHLWIVRVDWTTRIIEHRAKDEVDALEWADCYPSDAMVTVEYRQVPHWHRLPIRDGIWVKVH